MRKRQVREKGLIAWAGGLMACAALGLAGGHALATFAMGGINPFYFEQRWQDNSRRRAEPPLLTEGAQVVNDSYSSRIRPDWLYGPPPAPAFYPRTATDEGWMDEDPAPEPEREHVRVAAPLRMIEDTALTSVDQSDVAATGDTSPTIAEDSAIREIPER